MHFPSAKDLLVLLTFVSFETKELCQYIDVANVKYQQSESDNHIIPNIRIIGMVGQMVIK